jgi:hypothetical protein
MFGKCHVFNNMTHLGYGHAIERHGHMLTVKELAQLVAESPKISPTATKSPLDNWGGDSAMGIDLHARYYARGE